ncbi:alanyl-tRNA synthetase [Lachnospiraceae bacterium XBB1006]|nr:alanyl-tRNA synthetase [Lachnospiraceae bacterium XBB1006]
MACFLEEKEVTKKLYDEAPYGKLFSARVEQVKDEKGTKQVALSATMFFPEEGGQSPDWGTLAGYEVQDVQIKEGIIWHTLPAAAAIEEGQTVEGCIDFSHRYELMRHHSGEHLLSGLVHQRYGYQNVGFHLTEEVMTVDYDGVISEEELFELERAANEAIWKNIRIQCGYPEAERLKELEYRSKKEIDGPVRLVRIEGIDLCACCAPHVASTTEIGALMITGWENYKGGVRLTVSCGMRAIAMMQSQRAVVKESMRALSVKAEEIPEAIARLKEELQGEKGKKAALLTQLIEKKAAEMESAPVLVAFETEYDANAQRQLMNAMGEKAEKLAAVLVQTEEATYRYMMASNVLDMKMLQGTLKETFAAKGGGKSPMIQGTLVGKREDIEAFLKQV